MKLRKPCFYYLLVLLSVLSLCGCARSALPGESYSASESTNPDAPDSSSSLPDALSAQAEFDALTDSIFKNELSQDPLALHCFVRYPENFGIECPEMTLGDLSAARLKEATEDTKELKKELDSIDSTLLTADQLFTYRMLADYLETELTSEGMELYYQPLSPQIGIQAQLPIVLSEYSFYEKKDIEDYLTLLSTIDVYYDSLIGFEKERADAGLAPSDTTLDRIIQSCKNYLIRPESSFLVETFDQKLEDFSGLTEEEKADFKNRHLALLKEHFIPAYQNLAEELEGLKGRGSNENGLSHFPQGGKYYEYLVASYSGTASPIPELKRRIEKQIGNDMAEISLLAQNYPTLFDELDKAAFLLTDPREILNDLRQQSLEDFPELPGTTFTIKQVPKALEASLSPAFYLIPPIDAHDNNTIYINGMSEQTSTQLYPVLAHEGYPGHLYQSLYSNQTRKCPLRLLISCGGYSEGWGTYAEIYSYSFNNGLPEHIKKVMAHNQSSILALYALLDIHIHYDGWNLEKIGEFLRTYYGIDDPEVTKEIFEAIIDAPGNYLKYYTGYLEITAMKETAEKNLGNRYSPKAFHKFILDMEGASFRVIKPYFQTWLLTYEVSQ